MPSYMRLSEPDQENDDNNGIARIGIIAATVSHLYDN
jgi:hypothetical protein